MKSLYPNGHDVSTNALQFAEESREYEDCQRLLSVCGDQYGVVEGFVVTDISTATNKFDVSAGLAFDEFGYRVNMVSGITISGVTIADIGYYVVAYVDNSDTLPTSHRITGGSEYTREVDGASITLVSAVPLELGYVKLSRIENVTPGPAASITFSDTIRECREEFRIDPDILGTGTNVEKHRLSAHTDGISGGAGASLVPSIFDAATDYIEFTNVSADEWISIDGILLGPDEANIPDDVTFSTVTDPSGSWNIYINSSGNTGKTQAALTDEQFLIATVNFDSLSGDLDNLLDLRVFYETTQDDIRVDLIEAETNDSLTAKSTVRNNLNKIRYRLNSVEDAGKAYTVIANSGGDYNGNTEAIFTTAINGLPASGGTLVIADGEYNFSSAVTVNKPVQFVSHKNSIINITDTDAFNVTSDDVGFNGVKIIADNTTSGAVEFWGISSITNNDNLTVDDCVMEFSDTGAAAYDGGLLKLAGGHTVNVRDNHIESVSDSGFDSVCIVKVTDSPGNWVKNLNIINNTGIGEDGGVNILYFDSGSILNLNIESNKVTSAIAGVAGWIFVKDGVDLINTIISNNNLYATGDGSYLAGIIHIGVASTCNGGFIGGNAVTLDGSLGLVIYVQDTSSWVIDGNHFNSSLGTISYCNKGVISNNVMKGLSVGGHEGIWIMGDENSCVGNILDGSGTVGIRVSGDNNIIDGNQIDTNFTSGITDTGATNWATTTVDNTSNKVV